MKHYTVQQTIKRESVTFFDPYSRWEDAIRVIKKLKYINFLSYGTIWCILHQ